MEELYQKQVTGLLVFGILFISWKYKWYFDMIEKKNNQLPMTVKEDNRELGSFFNNNTIRLLNILTQQCNGILKIIQNKLLL